MYFVLEPEVAGGFGERTIFADRKARPPKLERFHYHIEGWTGDSLLEAVGCFIVTSDLAAVLLENRLTGFEIEGVEVTVSEEFVERYPGVVLPEFRWLKVTGRAGVDDFGLNSSCRLTVSQEALGTLKDRGTLRSGSYESV